MTNIGEEVFDLIKKELDRQNAGIELIASENYCSRTVREACGSILTFKYAEGYPQKRYYGGCEYIDKIEQLAIDNACKLFNCKYANVQPHSGSQANAAAYRALEKYLKITDRKMKILTMNLNDGAHLSHGSSVSFSSNLYEFNFFDLGDDGKLDFGIIEKAINEYKPDVLLSGYSAYPYAIDFSKFKELADKYNCVFMVDMAHIAGLVAAGYHQNPCDYADIVTTTTHKTLRGPRGGLILTNNEDIYKKVNSAVFPYYQGGPLENIIAGKAICFEEAMTCEFKNYIKCVIENTQAFTNRCIQRGISCSKTDNHLMLINTKKSFGITGLDAQIALEEIGITTNKNMIHNDTETPKTTSGLRIGFAAITTRGCNTSTAVLIADIICDYLSGSINALDAKYRVNLVVSSLKDCRDGCISVYNIV